MSPTEIKLARKLLGITQLELALALGWTTPRNVVNLERKAEPKPCMTQTALSIECLLRRASQWKRFTNTVPA
jgi:transcriptional regulator with XRE-family HTH domain